MSYVTPQLHTKFGEHAFFISGPVAWNSLPADLRTVSSFWRQRQTFLVYGARGSAQR